MQTASLPGDRVSAAHVWLGVSSEDDDCEPPQPGIGGGSSEMLRMLPEASKASGRLTSEQLSLGPCSPARKRAGAHTNRLPAPVGRRHIDAEEVVYDRLAGLQPYACITSVVMRAARLAGQGRWDYGAARDIVALEPTE
jgi:hypothetical protein